MVQLDPLLQGCSWRYLRQRYKDPEGVTSSVPNAMAFNATFLVGTIISLSVVAFMIIMKRRALKMGMPSNK